MSKIPFENLTNSYRRPFESLKTKAGQRVRIAKDALLQLKSKKLVSTPGTYLKFNSLGMDYDDEVKFWRGASVKKALATKGVECKVCALGSLICGIGSVNGDVKTQFDGFTKLSNYFTPEQTALIENMYEGALIRGDDEVDYNYKYYTTKYPNATTRLRKILQNIVKNRGTFVLPKAAYRKVD